MLVIAFGLANGDPTNGVCPAISGLKFGVFWPNEECPDSLSNGKSPTEASLVRFDAELIRCTLLLWLIELLIEFAWYTGMEPEAPDMEGNLSDVSE